MKRAIASTVVGIMLVSAFVYATQGMQDSLTGVDPVTNVPTYSITGLYQLAVGSDVIDTSRKVTVQSGGGQTAGISFGNNIGLPAVIKQAGMEYAETTSADPCGPSSLETHLSPTAANKNACWDINSTPIAFLVNSDTAGNAGNNVTGYFTTPSGDPGGTGYGWIGARDFANLYGILAMTDSAPSRPPFTVADAEYLWNPNGPICLQTNGSNSTNGTCAFKLDGSQNVTATSLAGSGTRCVQVDNTGKFAVASAACGTGSGGVSSVTGTAQRVSTSPTTGAVVVDTIGGFYSGAVSSGNEDLGTTLTNGLVCDTTTAGVAALRTCTSGTDYPAVGVATPGSCTNCSAAINANGQVTSYSSGPGAFYQTWYDGALSAQPQEPGAQAGVGLSIADDPSDGVTVLSLPFVGTAGSCTNCSVMFDAFGRETARSSGTAPVTSVGVTAPIVNTGTSAAPVIGISGGANQIQVGTGSTVGGFPNFVFTDSPLVLSTGSATPPTGYIGNFELNTNGAASIGVHNPNAGAGAQASLCAWQAAGSASPFTLPIFCMYQLGHGWTGAYGADAFAIEGYGGSSVSRTGPMYLRNYFGDVFLSAGSSGNGVVGVHVVNGTGQVVLPAGDLLPTAIIAPSTPGAGTAHVYVDSTSKNLAVKNDAGTVNHGAQTLASTAGVCATGLADNGSWTTQSFTVPGTAVTCAQLPALTGDATSTAGTCGTKVVEIHESGGLGIPIGACTTDGQAFVKVAGSMTCRLPAGDLSNDYTAPWVVAIHESSGPTRLTIGAIPDSNPDPAILQRAAGATSVTGVAPRFMGLSKLAISYGVEAVGTALYGTGAGGWMSIGTSAALDANVVESVVPQTVTGIRVIVNVAANTISGGAVTASVSRNGGGTTPTVATSVGGGSTGKFDSGYIAVTGTGISDSYGVIVANSCQFCTGSISAVVTMYLY